MIGVIHLTKNELRQISCCFTGHRTILPEHAQQLPNIVYDKIIELHKQGYINFLAGGALGFDTICAQAVLKAKQTYPSIRLILVLPCKNQTYKWKQHDIDIYNDILNKGDKVIYTSETYDRTCMFKRNDFLVNYTSYCICYQYKATGGTSYTTRLAHSNCLPIFNTVEVFNR